MNRQQLQHTFFFTLLIGTLLLVGIMFLPYLETIALAAAIAILVSPLHERLTQYLKGRTSLAASFVTVLVIIAIALPLSFVSFQIFQEAKGVYAEVSANRATYLQSALQIYGDRVGKYLPQLNVDPIQMLKQGASLIIGHFDDIFTSTVSLFVHSFLSLIALFYFLRDGKQFTQALMEYSPLPDRYDREIISKLQLAVQSVFRGSLLVALIQGAATGVGFAIFRVPNPALWGSLAAVCALIPGIGTSIILIPAIAYTFFTGHTIAGIGLTLWGIFAVGLIDNFLGPSLIGQGIRVHPLIILFSVIGGISLFGPLGFVFGPLSVSLLMALLEIYRLLLSRKNEKLPF